MGKIALLFGLNYVGTANELDGCISDVDKMEKLLCSRGFDCTRYTDQKQDLTSDRLLKTIRACGRASAPGDVVVIYYSGHGSQFGNLDGTESDGMDEYLDMSGYESVQDDELHAAIGTFPAGCRVRCMFDACHSGTILDLGYNWYSRRSRKHKHARARIVSDTNVSSPPGPTPVSRPTWSVCRDVVIPIAASKRATGRERVGS